MSQLQQAEWNVPSTLHTASQGWMLVSPQVPSVWPTLEKHSSGRQNKRLLIAGAFCLLSKMNQTLQKLVSNNAGCAVSPYHIPLILPPPYPTPGPALLRFLLLAHQYQLAAAWASQKGQMPWDEACWTIHQPQLRRALRNRRQASLEHWVSQALIGSYSPEGEYVSKCKEMVQPVSPGKWYFGI